MTDHTELLLARLDAHIRMMAPHQRVREAGVLLIDAAAAIRGAKSRLCEVEASLHITQDLLTKAELRWQRDVEICRNLGADASAEQIISESAATQEGQPICRSHSQECPTDGPAPAAATIKPVAWRHRWKEGGERDREWEMWSYSDYKPKVNLAQIIEPLYAALAPDRTAAQEQALIRKFAPLETDSPAHTLGKFNQTEINAKGEALRLERMEQAAKLCERVQSQYKGLGQEIRDKIKLQCESPQMKLRSWFLLLRTWRIHYIQAREPCWKGEIQVGPLLFGWQNKSPTKGEK
jgi:hypothetical protein